MEFRCGSPPLDSCSREASLVPSPLSIFLASLLPSHTSTRSKNYQSTPRRPPNRTEKKKRVMSQLHTADTNSFEEKGKHEHQEYAGNVVNHEDDPALQVSEEFKKKTM